MLCDNFILMKYMENGTIFLMGFHVGLYWIESLMNTEILFLIFQLRDPRMNSILCICYNWIVACIWSVRLFKAECDSIKVRFFYYCQSIMFIKGGRLAHAACTPHLYAQMDLKKICYLQFCVIFCISLHDFYFSL